MTYIKSSLYLNHRRLLGTRAILLRRISAFCTATTYGKIPHVERKGNILRSTHNLYIPNESFYNFLTRQLVAHRESIALVDGVTGRSYKYGDVYHLSRSVGTTLQKHGLNENDVLAILSFNRPEYITAILGAHGCRSIVSNINPSYTLDEIVHQLKDSGARMLFCEESFREKALKAADVVGLDKIFLFNDSLQTSTDVVNWSDIVREDGSGFTTEVNHVNPDDTIFLLYSSGTTGRSKGVMLTHKNIISNILQLGFTSQEPKTGIVLGLLPFYHIYGLMVCLFCTLYHGFQLVTIPSFQPERYLETIVNYKVNRVCLVPPLLIFSTKSPLVDKYDLSHVKEFTTGAAPCAANLFESMQKKFPNAFLRQGYGLTETSPLALFHPTYESKPGSTGVPAANTEVKIESTDTREILGPYETGEICIRGPQVMKGYLGKPEETSFTLTPDGWLYSGDIGYYDDDNHVYIVDRLKDLIKYKGFQVPPAELEDLLLTHEAVIDVAVIGMPDEEAGEIPKAFVVRNGDVTESDLIEFVQGKVAPHKRLRGGVEFVDEIPKAQSGKILRRLLRDQSVV